MTEQSRSSSSRSTIGKIASIACSRWRRAAILALVLLLTILLSGSPAPRAVQAAPPLQDPSDLCSLFPQGEGYKIASSQPGKECTIDYKFGRVTLTRVDNPDAARQAVSEFVCSPDGRSVADYGEYAKEAPRHVYAEVLCDKDGCRYGSLPLAQRQCYPRTYVLAFSRGCYYVSAQAASEDPKWLQDPKTKDNYVPGAAKAIQQIAAQIDTKLKTLPRCPGAAQPPPTAGIFGAGHGCSYNEANISPGQVRCVAVSTNAPPGAEIAFKWMLDGAVQPETRNTFTRDDKDLTPGEHTITVVAVDTKSKRESEASSFRFTKPGADLLVVVQCALRAGDDRAVACYADPKNAPAGAVLTYEWTWNGVPEGETSRTLSKVGLKDGSYTVIVRAKDSRSGKTAQGSTTVQIGTSTQPAAAGSGAVEVTTPTGTIVLKPDERTTITLPADRKAEIRARCEKVLYTIALMELIRSPLLVDQAGLNIDTAVVATLVRLECDKLLASAPHTLAIAGDLFRPSLAPVSAQEPVVQLNLELQQGSVRMVVVHAQVALDVKTATTAVTSQGKNTFDVAYNPTSRTSIVTASQGMVSIQPQRAGASSFTLGAGKVVTVTQNSVSPIAPIPQTDTDTGGLVMCGCLFLLGLAGLGVIVIQITRRRRQPAPQNSTRPRNLPN